MLQNNLNVSKRKLELQCAIGNLEKIVLASDPLRRTYNELRLPLYVREPGCWLSAPFGQGKSIAMEFCAKSLRKEIPGLPVFEVNEYVLPSNELRSFLRSALISSKYDNPDASKADILRNRLTQYWAELSFMSPLGCVVLLLDEGNSIREADQNLLKDIGNEIQKYHGALYTFVFGESPALDLVVAEQKEKHLNGATDRLWCGHKITLHCYESESDWKSMFKNMDNMALNLLNNRNIKDFFFGHMDVTKYKMEDEASRFWSALQSVTSVSGGNINLRRIFVGIRHAILTTAITTLDEGVTEFSGISESSWLGSLQYASLSDSGGSSTKSD